MNQAEWGSLTQTTSQRQVLSPLKANKCPFWVLGCFSSVIKYSFHPSEMRKLSVQWILIYPSIQFALELIQLIAGNQKIDLLGMRMTACLSFDDILKSTVLLSFHGFIPLFKNFWTLTFDKKSSALINWLSFSHFAVFVFMTEKDSKSPLTRNYQFHLYNFFDKYQSVVN